MDKLQREFDGKIQILPFTSDKTEDVENIFTRIKKQQDLILPSASESEASEILDLFNTNKKIWIYKGKLIAITDKDDVNSDHIKAVLNGEIEVLEKLRNENKKSFEFVSDFSKLQLNNTILRKNVGEKFQSVLSGKMEEYKRDIKTKAPREDDRTFGLRFINIHALSLYRYVYDFPLSGQIAKIEVLDKENLSNPYCYEIISANDENKEYKELQKEARKIMQKDLEEAFNYTIKKEKRKLKVYVLKKIKDDHKLDRLSSKGGKPVANATAFFINYENIPFTRFIKKLRNCLSTPEIRFILDETGIEGKINIDINAKTTDYKEMKKALKEYGLDLAIEERELEVFVMMDIK